MIRHKAHNIVRLLEKEWSSVLIVLQKILSRHIRQPIPT